MQLSHLALTCIAHNTNRHFLFLSKYSDVFLQTKRPRHVPNSLVNTFRRSTTAIRMETIMAGINFLEERLDVEQEEVVRSMVNMLKASTPKLSFRLRGP